jgi:glycosyltransferase involved in cell wall biosynthesis
MSYKYDVSIIIPSIGRLSLGRVLNQIFEDRNELKLQIIVIADGNDAMSRIQSFVDSNSQVELFQNNRTKGVSGSLNTGLLRAEGKYVMFFSDDDHWLTGKLKTSVQAIQGTKSMCICLQVKTLSDKGKSIIRPSYIPMKPINPLIYCYGSKPRIVNTRYISLTSFIAPIEVKNFMFPEYLTSREDIAWLQTLHQNDYEIIIKEGICAQVEIGYERTSKRDDSKELNLWLNWLEKNGPEIQSNFLFSHFLRPYVASANIFIGLKVLGKVKAWKYKFGVKNLLTFMFLITIGIFRLTYVSIFDNNFFKRIR